MRSECSLIRLRFDSLDRIKSPFIYLTDMDESPTKNRQAGADVEITPAMIEAGVNELCSYDWERDDPREVVSRILGFVLGQDVVTVHEISKGNT